MASVYLPYKLRHFCNDAKVIDVNGRNLNELINNLDKLFPGIKLELIENEKLKPGISAVIDGRSTRLGLIHKLNENSEVHFLPAIAGG
mgnify:CR=1 FL=1